MLVRRHFTWHGQEGGRQRVQHAVRWQQERGVRSGMAYLCLPSNVWTCAAGPTSAATGAKAAPAAGPAAGPAPAVASAAP